MNYIEKIKSSVLLGVLVGFVAVTGVSFGDETQTSASASASSSDSAVGEAKETKKTASKKNRRKSDRTTTSQTATDATTAAPAATTQTTPTTTPTTVPAAEPTSSAPQASEPVASAPATQVETVAVPSETKIIGGFELRPTWEQNRGAVATENEVELGVQLNKSTSLSYVQDFTTNVYDPKAVADGGPQGTNLLGDDGFGRAKFNNLWTSDNKVFSLHYEMRLYAPTVTALRDNGFITKFRQAIKLKAQVTDTVSLTLQELPILHAYSQATKVNGDANPGFENRVYLIGDASFLNGKLNLSVPLLFLMPKAVNHAGSKNSGAWAYNLVAWPEVTYSVSDNTALGIAYRTESLMAGDGSALTISDGFKTGVAQIILQASL